MLREAGIALLAAWWRSSVFHALNGVATPRLCAQDAEVAERTLVLQKVFNRYTAGRLVVTDTEPDVSGSASFSMLIRSLISPISSNRAVFEHIVSCPCNPSDISAALRNQPRI